MKWPAKMQGWLRRVPRSLGSRVRKDVGRDHLRSLAGHFRNSGKMGIDKVAEYKRAIQAARRNSLRRKTR
jgi:hypothetical protein